MVQVPPIPGSRASLLIVDDDPHVLGSLARLLRRSYDVLALSSPSEALRRIEAGERWSVILSDVMMPEMTGLELARRISEGHPELEPRIVLMTGGAFGEDVRASLQRTTRPVVQKPIELAALREVVEKVRREG